MHFTCRSFIGRSTPAFWSQFWESEPDDSSIVSVRGHLFGLVLLQDSAISSSDLGQSGRQLIQQINETYYSQPEVPLAAHLSSLISQYSSSSTQLVFVVYHRSQIYLISTPGLHAFLKRSPHFSHLLQSPVSPSVITGPIQAGDELFLLTDDFLHLIDLDSISEFINQPELSALEDNFTSLLYAQDDQSGLGAALIRFNADDFEISPPLPISPPRPTSSVAPSLTLPRFNPSSWFKRLLRRPTFVNAPSFRFNLRRRFNLSLALLILFLLGFSSYYSYRKNKLSQAEKSYQTYKTAIDQKLTDAQAIRNLNLQAAQDLAHQAQDQLNLAKKLLLHSDETQTYQQKITAILSQTGSASDFTPEQFFDTSLIVDHPQYRHLVFDSPYLYLLDPSRPRLDSLDASQKSTKLVTQDDGLKDAITFAYNSGKPYLLTANSVYQIGSSATKLLDLSSQTNLVDFAFWNGALYFLDPTNLSILKSNPNSQGFSAPAAWLKGSAKLSGTPKSLAINGSIWVLSADGKVTPYLRGQPQSFSNPEGNYQSADNLLTAVDTDLLVFVDQSKIVYVFNKSGHSLGKYNFGDRQISDIALDEKNRLVYVLCQDQKIYRLQLSF
jgi:hypothetical protein